MRTPPPLDFDKPFTTWDWKKYPTMVIAWPYHKDSDRYVNVPVLHGQKTRWRRVKMYDGKMVQCMEVQYTRDELETTLAMWRAMLMARQNKLYAPRATVDQQANADYFHLSNAEHAAVERTWKARGIEVPQTISGEQAVLL